MSGQQAHQPTLPLFPTLKHANVVQLNYCLPTPSDKFNSSLFLSSHFKGGWAVMSSPPLFVLSQTPPYPMAEICGFRCSFLSFLISPPAIFRFLLEKNLFRKNSSLRPQFPPETKFLSTFCHCCCCFFPARKVHFFNVK